MIKIQPLGEDRLEEIRLLRNKKEVQDICREYRYISKSEHEKWYQSYLSAQRNVDFGQQLWMLLEDDQVIGVGGFVRIQWRHRKGELTFYCVKDLTYHPTIIEIIDLGFNHLNLNKIYYPVYEHHPFLQLHLSLFDLEAVLKEEYFHEGKMRDRYYFSLLKDNNIDKN